MAELSFEEHHMIGHSAHDNNDNSDTLSTLELKKRGQLLPLLLTGRVNAIKMVFLPQFLYVFLEPSNLLQCFFFSNQLIPLCYLLFGVINHTASPKPTSTNFKHMADWASLFLNITTELQMPEP